jgi:putative addiction module killer protein
MFDLNRSNSFQRWLDALADQNAYDRIVVRLARMRNGHFGDVKYFDGIGELRIDYGPGYRIYFVRKGRTVVCLLCGGDKSSQSRDITRAKALAQEV